MAKGSEETFIQGRYINGQKALLDIRKLQIKSQ